MIYKTSAQLKSISRNKMLGQYGVAIGAAILMKSIEYFATSIGVGALDLSSAMGYVMYFGVVIIISLISSVFMFGEMSIYLKIACNVQAGIGDLFSGFKLHPDKPIIIKLIFMIISAVCYLIPGIMFVIYTGNNSAGLFATACILFAVSTLIVMYFHLCFALVYYLVLDYPQLNVGEAFGKSQALMHGHRFSLLYICVSFIPLYMLSLLTLGIGNLFIGPYRKMTLTEFYLDIAHNESFAEKLKQQSQHEEANSEEISNQEMNND